jgi:uncharacterized membrane protein YdjX (TVP38/TMEM64 family)
MLLVALAALAATAALLPLHRLPEAVAQLGALAPVVGVLLGSVLLVALVPRTPISMACGLLFGPALGILVALLVSVTAAVVTFAAGRRLGRDFLVRHSGDRLTRLDGWISRQGVLSVAAVRSLPIGPYGLAGYAYGATGIPVRDYVIGTAVAAPPAAVTYAVLGAAVASPGTVGPMPLISAGIGLLFSMSFAVAWRRRARAAAAATA